MTVHDPDDRRRLVDPWQSQLLDDVGLAWHSISVVSEPDGSTSLWLVDDHQLGAPDVDHGNECPPHELTGPLPAEMSERLTAHNKEKKP